MRADTGTSHADSLSVADLQALRTRGRLRSADTFSQPPGPKL